MLFVASTFNLLKDLFIYLFFFKINFMKAIILPIFFHEKPDIFLMFNCLRSFSTFTSFLCN